jgi:hypothetical protein
MVYWPFLNHELTVILPMTAPIVNKKTQDPPRNRPDVVLEPGLCLRRPMEGAGCILMDDSIDTYPSIILNSESLADPCRKERSLCVLPKQSVGSFISWAA